MASRNFRPTLEAPYHLDRCMLRGLAPFAAGRWSMRPLLLPSRKFRPRSRRCPRTIGASAGSCHIEVSRPGTTGSGSGRRTRVTAGFLKLLALPE